MATVPTFLRLAPRQLFVLPDTTGLRLQCTSGCLWLTLDHDPRDIILQPGDCFEEAAQRRAVVYALEASALVIDRRAGGQALRSEARDGRDAGPWAPGAVAHPG